MESYNLQRETDNVPRFNIQSVDLWFSFAKRTFLELVVCHLTAYGEDALSGLQEDEIEEIKKLFLLTQFPWKIKAWTSGCLIPGE
jgi:hypothetical protein